MGNIMERPFSEARRRADTVDVCTCRSARPPQLSLLHVAGARLKTAEPVGQRIRQYGPQPGGHLGIGVTAELIQALMRLEQGFLNHVRRIQT